MSLLRNVFSKTIERQKHFELQSINSTYYIDKRIILVDDVDDMNSGTRLIKNIFNMHVELCRSQNMMGSKMRNEINVKCNELLLLMYI